MFFAAYFHPRYRQALNNAFIHCVYQLNLALDSVNSGRL
jgi:hypothetical protein